MRRSISVLLSLLVCLGIVGCGEDAPEREAITQVPRFDRLPGTNVVNPTDNQAMTYDAASDLWVNETVAGGSDTFGTAASGATYGQNIVWKEKGTTDGWALRRMGPPIFNVRDYGAAGTDAQTTASITSGTSALSLTSATGWSAGNYFALHGAGAAHGLSTPAIAAAGIKDDAATGDETATYYYKIIALSGSGGQTAASAEFATAATADNTLAATDYVNLCWAPVANAAGYALYGRVTDGGSNDQMRLISVLPEGATCLMVGMPDAGTDPTDAEIGGTITGGATGDGILLAYDNTPGSKKWWVLPTDFSADTFPSGTALTVGGASKTPNATGVVAHHWQDAGDVAVTSHRSTWHRRATKYIPGDMITLGKTGTVSSSANSGGFIQFTVPSGHGLGTSDTLEVSGHTVASGNAIHTISATTATTITTGTAYVSDGSGGTWKQVSPDAADCETWKCVACRASFYSLALWPQNSGNVWGTFPRALGTQIRDGDTYWRREETGLPVGTPEAAVNDALRGQLLALSGTNGTTSVNAGGTVSAQLLLHDDLPAIVAAYNAVDAAGVESATIGLPNGTYPLVVGDVADDPRWGSLGAGPSYYLMLADSNVKVQFVCDFATRVRYLAQYARSGPKLTGGSGPTKAALFVARESPGLRFANGAWTWEPLGSAWMDHLDGFNAITFYGDYSGGNADYYDGLVIDQVDMTGWCSPINDTATRREGKQPRIHGLVSHCYGGGGHDDFALFNGCLGEDWHVGAARPERNRVCYGEAKNEGLTTISSVNASTEVVTISADSAFVTGDQATLENYTFQGTAYAGLSLNRDYFLRELTSTTYTLHPTAADALNNTNLVNITGTSITGSCVLVRPTPRTVLKNFYFENGRKETIRIRSNNWVLDHGTFNNCEPLATDANPRNISIQECDFLNQTVVGGITLTGAGDVQIQGGLLENATISTGTGSQGRVAIESIEVKNNNAQILTNSQVAVTFASGGSNSLKNSQIEHNVAGIRGIVLSGGTDGTIEGVDFLGGQYPINVTSGFGGLLRINGITVRESADTVDAIRLDLSNASTPVTAEIGDVLIQGTDEINVAGLDTAGSVLITDAVAPRFDVASGAVGPVTIRSSRATHASTGSSFAQSTPNIVLEDFAAAVVPSSMAGVKHARGLKLGNTHVGSPTALAAQADNYEPGRFYSLVRLTATGAQNISGIVARADGEILTLVNVDTADAITLLHESASSTAANRFSFSTGANIVLAANGGKIVLVYDYTSQRWRDQ